MTQARIPTRLPSTGRLGMKAAIIKRVDRQSCRARHEGRNQNGGQPVALVLDGAGRHDGRHGTGVGREQRDKSFAVEPDGAHHAVGNQCRPSQVTRVLKNADEKKEQQDLRQEDQYGLHAIPQAIAHQRLQPPDRDSVRDMRAEVGETGAHPVAQRLADGEDHLEDHDHDGKEDEWSPDAVQQDGIEPAGPQRRRRAPCTWCGC